MTTQQLRQRLERQRGQKIQIEQTLEATQNELRDGKRSLRQHEQAREIIREVGIKTQEQLQFHISDITSLALDSVFNDPYQLKVEFVQRRNKTECDLLFKKKDKSTMKPIDSSGGGAVDVAAFALRIASWSMMHPRTRPVIILDEPLRFLSADNQEKASVMIKELSQRLGLQFIIVTHEPILASYADKVFEVKIKNGRSKVITS
jgi:DNA repair exonuclease SbcCD ATPase subunit